jgi:hypothetical protein
MANSQRSSSSPPRRPQAENRDFVTGLLGFRDRLNAGSRRRISSPRDRAVPRRRPRCPTSTMPRPNSKVSARLGRHRPAGCKVTVASQANFRFAKSSPSPASTTVLGRRPHPDPLSHRLSQKLEIRGKKAGRDTQKIGPHPASHTSPREPRLHARITHLITMSIC